jgi:hypothetical protein
VYFQTCYIPIHVTVLQYYVVMVGDRFLQMLHMSVDVARNTTHPRFMITKATRNL